MQAQDYAYLYELEENFWWFRGMREITRSLLNQHCEKGNVRSTLDAGCGTGGMLSWLSQYTGSNSVVGIDLSQTALEFCRERNHQQLTQGSIAQLPFADSSFDLVTSFDVLQHVLDKGDVRAIAEIYRVLRPGGLAFVRVSAYEWLRSGHDEALAVQRRYTLGELTDEMRRAGFSVRRATYANSLLLPVAAIKRLVLSRFGSANVESEVKPWPKSWRWLNGLMS
ncbi:MAG TPA: class I SAM-dependent methyltransferase, partial [Pyrinomonadaceae bacterium]|nr:class I SAM-dependent methyltransferase [Pyrinomonadaceae bacterium]